MKTALLMICLAGAATAASAQRAAPRVPADPAAPAPKPSYASAFTDYRPWNAAPETVRWRDANDTMRELRGHAGHVKPAVTPPAPPTQKAKP